MGEPPADGAAVEMWVDAFALDPGDGSRAHPFKSLAKAMEVASEGAWIHLATGLYRGPFLPAARLRLTGSSSSVLVAETMDAVVRPRGALVLEDLAIQGGAVGIETSFDLRLKRIHFSGQRQAAMELSGGSLTAEQCIFAASVSELRGLVVSSNAAALLTSCTFDGPFRRALEVKASPRVEVVECRFEGPATGVHQIGGKVRILRSHFSGGRGPAVFAANGELMLQDVVVRGHEYGLQAGEGAVVKSVDFYSIGADRAAVALVKARGELEGLFSTESGAFGAVQLVGAEASIRGFWLHRPANYGVSARNSKMQLRDGLITEVRNPDSDAGNAIEARATVGILESLLARTVSGSGVLAAEGSRLSLREVTLERCAWTGVTSETLSTVDGSGWTIRSSGVAIAVPDHSEVRVDDLVVQGNHEAVAAECRKGALIVLSRVQADAEVKGSPCTRQVPGVPDRSLR
jgi:hypothetical protein